MWASINVWQFSSPFITMHSSLGFLVCQRDKAKAPISRRSTLFERLKVTSGHAQHILQPLSFVCTFDACSKRRKRRKAAQNSRSLQYICHTWTLGALEFAPITVRGPNVRQPPCRFPHKMNRVPLRRLGQQHQATEAPPGKDVDASSRAVSPPTRLMGPSLSLRVLHDSGPTAGSQATDA